MDIFSGQRDDEILRVEAPVNDVIDLNVGGRLLTTTRGLLKKAGGRLAYIFSGQRDDEILRDRDGRFFLDYDPDAFVAIVDHLRLRELEPVDWAEASPPPGKERHFEALKKYLLAWSCFASITGGVQVVGQATSISITVPMLGGDEGCAVCAAEMQAGTHTWAFEIKDVGDPGYLKLGITRAQGAESTSEGEEACWSGDGFWWKPGDVGHWEEANDEKFKFRTGDTVKMLLDADNGMLRMKVARLGDQEFCLEGPGLGQPPWRVLTKLSACSSVSLCFSEF